jgi:predicted transcriptional regulator
MLEHLFGSRTRVRLIGLFLGQPDDPIFVREVTRRIDTQINAVRRELANLERFGLIVEAEGDESEAKRPGVKRKYYRLNRTFPLLPEVRSLMMKAHLLVEHRIDKTFDAMGTVKYAALMGAFLGIPNSPVDLFVIGTIDADALKKLVQKLEKSIGSEINYTVMAPQEYAYRKEMGDKFLYQIVEAPKNVIVNRLDESSAR